MNRNIFIILIFLSNFSYSERSKVGIAGAIGDREEIKIPIEYKSVLIEPFISHYESSEDSSVPELRYSRTYEETSLGLGIGIWRIYHLDSKIKFQIGAQAAYIKNTNSHKGIINQDDSTLFRHESNSDGYEISPGFGLFYSIHPKLDIGMEVKYIINDVSERTTQTEESTIKRQYKRQYSTTQLTARFYF